jgi:hypothetical protein
MTILQMESSCKVCFLNGPDARPPVVLEDLVDGLDVQVC